MVNKKIFFIFLVMLSFQNAFAAKLKEGEVFPIEKVFQSEDLFSDKTKIKSYKNKVILIDFWASWCEPCKAAIKHYNQLYLKYSKNDFVVLGINVDENKDLGLSFLKANKVAFSMYYDRSQQLAKLVDLEVMPTAYLINQKSIILKKNEGYSRGDDSVIEKLIRQELKLTSQ